MRHISVQKMWRSELLDLIQHTVAHGTGEGCSMSDADKILTDWEQAN